MYDTSQPHIWGMNTQAAEDRLDVDINRLVNDMRTAGFDRWTLEMRLHEIFRRLSLAGHTEIMSHAVRTVVYGVIDDVCAEQGWRGVLE